MPHPALHLRVKVISLHHRLAGLTSHHFNEAHGLIEEFRRRGRKFELLINVRAPKQISKALHADAVLDDPTFRMEWSFEERSRRFVEMLHQRVDRRVRTGDCVLLTISTQLEAHALTRWLQQLPGRKKPWIVIVFLSDRWNRSGAEEYERQRSEFRQLHAAIASLSLADAAHLLFFAVTEPLAEELSEMLGSRVEPAPMPLPYGDPEHYPIRQREASVPRVMILGGTRREKGSHWIPEIIEACRTVVRVEFLVQVTNDNLPGEDVERLALIAGQPGVSIISAPMSLDEYNLAINSADIALFPYEVVPYRKRTSGVFGEAVAYGKPVVATAGTWMAEQIERGQAAGVIIEELRPESVARAIARCVDELDELRRTARRVSDAWRKSVSLPAFLDLMEAKIAERAREAAPARRSWWRR